MACIRINLFLIILTILAAIHVVDSSPILDRRAGPTLAAPSGWKVSWNVDRRLSTGSSTRFISSVVIDRTATIVSQAHLNACVAKCSTTAKCGFVNLVKQSGSSQGNVMCLLFPQYLASKSATFASAALSSTGTVNYSYGVRSLCAPTNGGALTCTPAAIITTTSILSSKTTSTLIKTSSAAITTTARASSTTAVPLTSSVKTTTSTTTTSSKTTSTFVATTASTTTISTTATTSTTIVPLPTVSNAFFTTLNDSSLPSAPAGALLVQWKPCSSALRNPALLNNPAWKGSNTATAAYIVQHGAGSDISAYFTSLYNVVGDQYPIVAAGFMTDDGSNPLYRKDVNLAWASTVDSWTIGQDDTTGASCSSYDQYDSMIDYLAKSGKFPSLQTIYLVGHSGGGNLISRFSTINTNSPVTMKYIVINAANQAYFTDVRPSVNVTTTCAGALSYPYQWTGSMPRYISSRFSDANALFSRWIGRSVVHLVGDRDLGTGGTQNCQSTAQGGSFRRDRNYAYWAYQNILAGTGSNVSQYTGYAEMIAQGATQIASGSFNHQGCTVANATHNIDTILQSDCGRAAIFGLPIPAGVGASYPLS